MSNLKEAREKLFQRRTELQSLMRIALGETAAPGYAARARMEDTTRIPLNEEYRVQLAPEFDAFASEVRKELAAKPELPHGEPLNSENVWLWGGPTPEWGGSMQPDTLVRNAAYFNAENGVYVYRR